MGGDEEGGESTCVHAGCGWFSLGWMGSSGTISPFALAIANLPPAIVVGDEGRI